jgi:DNA-binding GntR family transcriptional regulator
MAEAEDFRAYRRADVGFHLALAEAAESLRLVSAMTEVQGGMTDLIAHIPAPRRGARASQRPACAPGGGDRPRRRERAVKVVASTSRARAHPAADALRPERRRAVSALTRSPARIVQRLRATSPATQSPKISTSTAVPGAACSAGRYA